jgi:hypothetical protein
MFSAIGAPFQGISRFQVLFPKTNVKECGWIFIGLLKAEPVNNIIAFSSNVIIDMYFIMDIFSKLVMVWPAQAIVGT